MSSRKRDSSSLADELSRREGHRRMVSSSLHARRSPSSGAPNHRFDSPSAAQPLSGPRTKRPVFVSYLDTPDVPPKIKLLCEIIAKTPALGVEHALDDTGIRVSQENVEEVLKLSYGFPSASVKFFRWARRHIEVGHSPYAWNLIVDMLGKNFLFDAMWDSVKTMRQEGISSLATFASVFSSYVAADRVNDAIMTFEVLDQYGVLRDVMAFNSLLSAICRDGQTSKAQDFLERVIGDVRPDSDTYAILLEGWENEGNVARARIAFETMINRIGWDPLNVPAYDSFLTLLVKGSSMEETMRYLNAMRSNNCYPGMKFFKTTLDTLCKQGNHLDALPIWKMMLGAGIVPENQMHNAMIGMLCRSGCTELALQFFDDMVYCGACPDALTYNVLFHTLLKERKSEEAACIFREMIKNECELSRGNCEVGIKLFIDASDPDMAIRIWKHVVEKEMKFSDRIPEDLILGLQKQNRLPEACKYAEEMLKRGIPLSSETLLKLKHDLSRVGKEKLHARLVKK